MIFLDFSFGAATLDGDFWQTDNPMTTTLLNEETQDFLENTVTGSDPDRELLIAEHFAKEYDGMIIGRDTKPERFVKDRVY